MRALQGGGLGRVPQQELRHPGRGSLYCRLVAGARSEYKHFLISLILSLLLLADASVTDHENTKDLYHLCGVFSVLSLLMVNTISNGHLQSDGGLYTEGILSGVAAKIWFFVGFLFGFG